eukprot:182062_1
MPHGIYGGSCVLKNGSIYYFGGKVHTGGHTASIMKYNIERNVWTTLASTLSSSYFGSQAILLNNTNVFIIGGAGLKYQSYLYYGYNAIHNFDILTESISFMANMNVK